MTEEYKCPKCGSENVQRYSVAYQTGASTIDVNTTGAGFGGGHFGVGSAHSKGTQHTHMAASTAPPSKKRLLIPALLFFFAGFLVVGCTCKGRIADILLWCIIAADVFFVYTRYKWNKTTWPKLYADWQRSFVCLKCGYRFMA